MRPSRHRSRVPSVAAIVALACTAACAPGGGLDGTPFTAVTFPGGDAVSASSFEGEAVLLAGWATWCVPCERELPLLDAYADVADPGLRIVAVNVDTASVGDGDVAAMLDRLDVGLPVWRDADGALLTRFGGSLMPFSVLLGRDGEVVRTWSGALDVDDDEFAVAVADALE